MSQSRFLFQSGKAGPGFCTCTSPCRLDNSQRASVCSTHITCKVICCCRKALSIDLSQHFRCTKHPSGSPFGVRCSLRNFNIGQWLQRRILGNKEQTQQRIFRSGYIVSIFFSYLHPPFHIRLSGSNPYIAYQHIRVDKFVLTGNCQELTLFLRFYRFQVHFPCSVSVSSRFHFLSGKDYLYGFSGISPSKDGNLCVLLQHHVITEDQRHPYIGFHLCQPKAYGQQEYP